MSQPRIKFSWLSLNEVRALGFDDMVTLNWEEVETDNDQIPLAINWPAYYGLERAGVLKFGAALVDGKLAGYSVWFVQPQLHHMGTSWAVNDLIYLEPDFRRGYLGVLLIRWAERQLKDLGVKVITYQVKPTREKGGLGYKRGRDSVGALLQKLGYTLAEEAWQKIL